MNTIHKSGVITGQACGRVLCDICHNKANQVGSVFIATPSKIPGTLMSICVTCAKDLSNVLRLALMDHLLFPEETHKR